MADDYSDIINIDHWDPKIHPRMPREQRAAQFKPFAALSGYDKALEETMRETVHKRVLDEDERAALDEKLQQVIENPDQDISIEYFKKDKIRLDGTGEYLTFTGKIRKVDTYAKVLLMDDGTRIPIADVSKISTT